MTDDAPPPPAAIRCRGLAKNYRTYSRDPGLWGSIRSLFRRRFKDVAALAPFDLEVRRGEIVGLLGANGAGKTTCMKMLAGVVVPTGGDAAVAGHVPWRRENAFKRRIALVMGQKAQLWWDLPAHDSYRLLKEIYEIPDSDFRARLETLAGLLGVTALLGIQIRRLSLGERMKMEIIACLLHQPEVVLLDEPTIGLDVNAQETIREFFRRYQRDFGATIVLTSHYMADIEALCPRVVLLVEGVKRYDGPIRVLADRLGHLKRLTLHFDRDMPRDDGLFEGLSAEWKSPTEVELMVPRDRLKELCSRFLKELPVQDFRTSEVPFEKVVGQVMANPELLR
jgi:ABC-2 type transport system ATP-binding protein